MWERVKFTERFKFVDQEKVKHIVVDDVLDQQKVAEDHWFLEDHQTEVGVQRVLSWAKDVGLDEDSLLISANTDEVLSRSVLQQLSGCELVHRDIITGVISV